MTGQCLLYAELILVYCKNFVEYVVYRHSVDSFLLLILVARIIFTRF